MGNKKIKALVCAALLFLLLAPSLSGCGLIVVHRDGHGPAPAGTESTSANAEIETAPDAERPDYGVTEADFGTDRSAARAALAALPDFDLTGQDFLVAAIADKPNTLFPEGEDRMAEPCAERGEMVSEKYHCGFVPFSAPEEEFHKQLTASVKAGTARVYADLVVLPSDSAVLYMNEGLLLDLRRLPFYTAGIEDRPGRSGAAFTGRSVYFDLGAAVYDTAGIYVLYFNRTAVGAETSERLFAAALADGMDWEEFFTLTAGMPAGSVASGSAGAAPELLAEIAAVRAGFDFLSTAVPGKAPELLLTGEGESAEALTAFLGRLASLKPVLRTDADAFFMSGGAPFYVGTLAESAVLCSAHDAVWGVLPLPAHDPMTPNFVRTSAPVLAVPANNNRIEETGLILTALDTASGTWLRGECIRRIAESYLRDNTSCLVLRKIAAREIYRDPAYLFASVCPGLAETTSGAVRRCLTAGIPVAEAAAEFRKTAEESLAALLK